VRGSAAALYNGVVLRRHGNNPGVHLVIDLTRQGRALHRIRPRRPRLAGAAPALLAATLITALVAGCSSSDDGADTASAPATGPLPDAAQIVQESARTTQTLQSVHLDLDVNNIPNLPVADRPYAGDVWEATLPHLLGEAELVGLYPRSG